jgi:hypothetical protein
MSNIFGSSSLLYKGRFPASYPELDYSVEAEDYVIYPEVVRSIWKYYIPLGGNTFSGTDYPTSGGSGYVSYNPPAPAQSPATLCEFLVTSGSFTDPFAYRMTFKLWCGADSQSGTPPNLALCNYAHSIFNQVLVRFNNGSGSSQIDQVQNYNVFTAMWYKFYTTNYVQRIHLTQEGYETSPALRQFQGREFALPINVGFFMSMRKHIPNCILPQILIQFYMETVAVATCAANGTDVSGTSATAPNTHPFYYIANVQLLIKEIITDQKKIDDERRSVASRQSSAPMRLDYSGWQYFSNQIPATTSGQFTAQITGNFVGLRKFMFGMINRVATATAYGDQVNNFTLSTLQSYRLQINGNFYPTQDVYINQGGAASQSGEQLFGATAYFYNMEALGINKNIWSDMIMNWSPASAANAIFDWVFIISTEFDDAGLPILHDAINSGQVGLVLNFGSTVGSNPINLYSFANSHKCVMVYEGNRAEVIYG